MRRKSTINLSYKEKRDILFLKSYQNKNNFSKLCVLSHFDLNNKIENYVVFMVKEMYKLKFDIVFVTTAEKMKVIELNKISHYIKIAIIKKNSGYDFMSWKTGLFTVGNYSYYKQIVHINDSIFFPLVNPKNLFHEMNKENVDFWGLSDSVRVKYHIQSFFWVFNQKLVKSVFFNKFWNSVTSLNDKGLVIRQYEIAFTSLLVKNNFQVSCYNKIEQIYAFAKKRFKHLLPIEEYTSFYAFWDIMIQEFKSPFLKKNILLSNNLSYHMCTSVYQDILQNSYYNPKLISKYLKENNHKNQSSSLSFNQSVELLENLIQRLEQKKKVIIYGYSHIGIFFHSILSSKVIEVVDTNYLNINKKNHHEYRVKSPEVIKSIEHDCILICTLGREDEVIKGLNEKGIYNHIFTMQATKPDSMRFSGNMTSLLRKIEVIAIENQKSYFYIRMCKTQNPLIKYLLLYNHFKGLPTIELMTMNEHINKNKIIFNITDKRSHKIINTEFYPV